VSSATPRTKKSEEASKMKKSETDPYIQKLGAFLMKNEDNIRKYFETECERERQKGGKEGEKFIQTCDVFLEHMDDIRKEIGGNPENVESYEKVWERVQRRMRRLEQLHPQPPPVVATTSSSSSDNSPKSAGFIFGRGMSISFGSADDVPVRLDQSSSPSFSTSDDDVGETTTEDVLDDVQELEEARETLLSRTDINPDGKVIFKCWRGKQKKMVILPLSTINWDELRSAVAAKFNMEVQRLKLAYGDGNPPTSTITNNSTFSNFLQTAGTMAESTIVYSLHISL
jgi:hypothetical protein